MSNLRQREPENRPPKQRKRSRKRCFRLGGGAVLLLTLGIGADMLISRSVYRPLTHVYQAGSWFFCQQSPACQDQKYSTREVVGKRGMVVTEQQEASAVGVDILKSGGNAIDAAVAIGYALAVTYPCCGNLGGGGFMLIRQADGKETVINFREKAPLRSHPQMYLNEKGQVQSDLSRKGYLAVGVPGSVAGLERALTAYGTMTRQQVMAPAIKLAENGFVLQAGDVDILKKNTRKFSGQPNVAAIFLKNGKPFEVGDRLVQTDLARTLKQISQQGPPAFYTGAIAQEVVRESNAHGGILTLQDFQSYSVSESKPLRCQYRGYTVLTTPLPGGGVTACQMLTILNGYSLKPENFRSAESLHRFLSTMVFAYADRNKYLGDPEFVRNPVNRLLSPEYAAQIRQQIQPDKATSPKQLYADSEGEHTTHYSVVDRFGNVVSVTYTINSLFGAEVIAGKTGFFLNNEMDDFATQPGVANQFGLVQGDANAIAPGKRPLSSMAPTLVIKDGKPWIVTGSPGGPTISTTILQVVSNIVDYGMTVEQSVATPRIHYQGLPNVVVTEPFALEPAVVQSLWEKGYRVVPIPTWGAAESILIDQESTFHGVNDPRKSAGQAAGY